MIFEREGRGRERRRRRIQRRLQALSCQHRHGARIHEPWDHELGWSWPPNWLSHPGAPKSSFFKTFLYMYVCITLQQGRGRERGRERIPSWFSVFSAKPRGLFPGTVRSWPEPKSRIGCSLSWATQVPQHFLLWLLVFGFNLMRFLVTEFFF